ncbi:oligopeptide transport system ATP-binding protein [Clostridium acetobutylicum]|uniref:Oligopeptide ABC transporter, ATPase component n=1 Tax=Clostridium acetobutylicum (strain ATCC 824 / DSM 792 / JCM 1419 / IAM 19013 / LMG 5710 / NBRC 13948 / NRRL B-527 / VKM B-1787 / 2291 / W) TaxID=272562 RepID=Q97D44_CLOAB|nr:MULTISPECIES: ABC transporter ATP-binding protein [Clostridium]AAK81559.1 Oligopeptide ABC transporter, ATPase component [Clostridium acetobutylicum ATCC 824]ADZ22680.1 Oligopeptide ABC transporter, ATPase component [Clostridium acetobutylicum EA 2018]AEI34412.1 oligopeptide ABC transporter, ATPase component [Clostridium acetobutylicum DSM 1731]AWV80768.1 ABC transporter ATP-binding protein [Clostridium acetobutylicum]MBC2393907.1 ABC transporter ATP-binding protein [Clostridium acetobutyli
MEKLLEIKNLNTSFFTHLGEVKSVRGISFELNKGEALGIVGESGSGKSVTMMSVMGLLQENGKIVEGEIIFNGMNITHAPEKEMEKIRGNKIGMIFQDPMTSLNPVLTIGNQIAEGIKKHLNMNTSEAIKRAIEMLKLVGIPSPEKRMKQYPHEFSGGMRQRVMIAMAIACKPELLIADEPTTALDVTIQAQILELMKKLKEKMNTSIILITHDLGVVANLCSKINVMYGGLIVEKGDAREIFYNPKHPYTLGLLKSIPDPTKDSKEKLVPIDGYPPDLLNPPKGCPFAARCPYTMEICMEMPVPSFKIGENHEAACWLNHPDAPKVNPINERREDNATR